MSDATLQVKRCGRCGEQKLATEFYRSNTRPGGYQAWCKSCSNEYSKKDKKRKERVWSGRLGVELTYEQYKHLLGLQGGCCKLCQEYPTEDKLLCVDHNHTTGEVRGLLCVRCNRWVGLVEANPELFQSIQSYLVAPVPALPGVFAPEVEAFLREMGKLS